jgi:hypothetical protein
MRLRAVHFDLGDQRSVACANRVQAACFTHPFRLVAYSPDGTQLDDVVAVQEHAAFLEEMFADPQELFADPQDLRLQVILVLHEIHGPVGQLEALATH